ncbi:serine hydrolase domain-containing protein [Nocardia sp. NPDC059764]|uniref:serine hydrolase domain-containing protein n=1 Tax=Nocardia sp. NPDC059764 TaxID=3346939 RepID=UPI00364615E9
MLRASANPHFSHNDPEVLAAGWPAVGLVTSARGLARFYSDLVAGEFLLPDVLARAVGEQVRGRDRVPLLESAYGLGYVLPSENMILPVSAAATAFGHPGAGGAIGLGDLTHRVAIACTPNLRRDWLSGDRRAYNLVDAVYSAL